MTLSSRDLRVERVDPATLYDLRRRVLRNDDPDASVADVRDRESTSLHFGGYLEDRLVVSASFFRAPAPVNVELSSYQLRFMATDVDAQGCGYGAAVLEVALEELALRGAHQVWAKARDTALGFYRRTGWNVLEGSEHLSPETHLPHTVIIRMLVTAA